MAITQQNKRPRFEEESGDFVSSAQEIITDNSDLNLPPLNASKETDEEKEPEAIVREALEMRPVEAVLDPDTRFGPVVIPKEDTLWDYKYLLSEGTGTCNIQFSPKAYAAFDAIIVKECGLDAEGESIHAGFRKSHRKHNHYAPLRRNLAILRNYFMVTYPPAKDTANLAVLSYMAGRLGEVLRGEAHRPSTMERIRLFIDKLLGKEPPEPKFNRFLELANTADRGIAFMYHYIDRLMAKPSVLENLAASSQLPKDWKLLPLDRTPFSAENMELYSDAARMSKIAEAFDIVVQHLRSVNEMHEVDKEISVEHARDILKNMRIIATGMTEEKEYDVLDPRAKEAHSMLQAAVCFQGNLADIAKNDPALLDDPNMIDAVEVIGKVSKRIRSEEKNMAKQQEARAPEPDPKQQSGTGAKKSKSRPSYSSKPKGTENIGQLMYKFEESLTRASEARKKSHLSSVKRKSDMAHVMGKGSSVHKALKDSQSMMASPKIHSVSLADPEFLQTVKQINEPKVPEPAKETINEPGMPGNATRR